MRARLEMVRVKLRIDSQLSDAACDELGVLGSVIQNEDEFRVGHTEIYRIWEQAQLLARPPLLQHSRKTSARSGFVVSASE
jgi:hypothetical protein